MTRHLLIITDTPVAMSCGCFPAGSGFWDTPMTRHLLKSPTEAELAAAVQSFDRPNSSNTPADMYTVLLRMPLEDVFWYVE
jgi:hypothetical protein